MGVFSYLNIKKPASMIWKALSPSRDLGEAEGGSGGSGSDLSECQEDLHMVKVRRGLCSPQAQRMPLVSVGRWTFANLD